ncbi:hypothetical protein FXO38_20309 [Capsicum annuum]|uniref:Uncharacterized protein n=1 Tax=Capsicum annuum TaxID=4072 RepID=A0A2G2YNP8_CAPAN|nr:hypothetical protein FXO38_20309 [Capsicum annuum]KAF3673669.1 hypothetical protein FXO37_06844 [Capsicum annuum]PHT71377.1 hypothetical protein T459_26481 [Capsicum annuum]
MDEEEKQEGSDPQLSEMKARLDKLEDTLKENVVESKKQSGDVADKPIDNGVEKEPATTKPGTPNIQEKTTPSSEGKTQAKAALPDRNHIKKMKVPPMTQTNEISRIYYFMIVELSEGEPWSSW